MTIHVYKSTDAGAPVLSNTAGAVNQILKACLVTGYGNKDPAGWELVYDSRAINPSNAEQRICLRSNDPISTRTFYEVENATNVPKIMGYADWDNVSNQGLLRFHPTENRQLIANNFNRWLVIANSKSVYVFTPYDKTSFAAAFFGDYLAFNRLDKNAILCAAQSSGTTAFAPASTNGGNYSWGILANGLFSALNPCFMTSAGFGNRYYYRHYDYYYFEGGLKRYFKVPELLGYKGSNPSGVTLLGYLPGLLDCPMSNQFDRQDDLVGYHNIDNQEIMEINIFLAGKNFINLTNWDMQ